MEGNAGMGMDGWRRERETYTKGSDSASFSVSLQATHNRRSEKKERRDPTIQKYRILLYPCSDRQVGRRLTGMHTHKVGLRPAALNQTCRKTHKPTDKQKLHNI